MSISAAQVKQLRDMTGAGMMDCKAALAETDGDIEAAVDWLRKKGIAKADKKAGRTAAEGLIGVAADATSAVVVEVNSETDFVARNEAFQDLVRAVAEVALGTDGSRDAVGAAIYPAAGKPVDEAIKDAVATIGENMNLRRSAKLAVPAGAVATYIHNAAAEGLGKIGVLVAVETTGDAEAARAFARQVAMHVAATSPLALTPEEVDPAAVAREKEIFAAQARESGKPDNIIEKIIEGQVNKFYGDICLVEQAFVKDPDKSVQKYLDETGKALGGAITLKRFTKFVLGEGLEKKESDFAAEVAAAAGL